MNRCHHRRRRGLQQQRRWRRKKKQRVAAVEEGQGQPPRLLLWTVPLGGGRFYTDTVVSGRGVGVGGANESDVVIG